MSFSQKNKENGSPTITFGNFRKRKFRVAPNLLGILLPIVIVESCLLYFVNDVPVDNNVGAYDVMQTHGRSLLQLSNNDTSLNCTPRAIHQFPDDFMTPQQRQNGGVTFHIFISLYLLVAIAIACDDFFVPSLEMICEVLQLQPDVAGATLMAAGSSAPEFFASVIGIFFAKSDVGLSTIVGSAVFNLLLVNAVVGLLGGVVIYLAWWPVIRDCVYYLASVLVLIVVMADERVHWYESLVMVLLYMAYVGLMYFNRPVGYYLMTNINWGCLKTDNDPNADASSQTSVKRPLLHEDSITNDNKHYYGSTDENLSGEFSKCSSRSYSAIASYEVDGPRIENSVSMSANGDRPFQSPLRRPPGCWRSFLWVIMLPATLVMTLTIPDYRRGGSCHKLYSITFLMSCLWIAGLSYVMMWMATIAGDTLGIPDTVMGLTFLAIGTSVPDAIASLIVAKDGYGDMAVSNSVGSNVFDILLCLGLPWLIQTGMVEPNSVIQITSRGLTYSTITLLGTILFLVAGFMLNRWKLDKKFGFVCLLAYVLVVLFSCLNELNVFGYVNPPACPW